MIHADHYETFYNLGKAQDHDTADHLMILWKVDCEDATDLEEYFRRGEVGEPCWDDETEDYILL